jgi:pyruvate ferredoxin oxidoreductase delta subunit
LSPRRKQTGLTSKDISLGSIIANAGNAVQYKTGDWRSERPVLNKDRCIKCGICYIYCPEGCIRQNPEGHFEADLYHCKGHTHGAGGVRGWK